MASRYLAEDDIRILPELVVGIAKFFARKALPLDAIKRFVKAAISIAAVSTFLNSSFIIS